MIKKINFFFFIQLLIFLTNHCKYVSYYSSGLLGDRLIQYSIAKWISWKYNMPLLYEPFCNSDLFVLHDQELLDNSISQKYKNNTIAVKSFSDNSFVEDCLYRVTAHSCDKQWDDYTKIIDDFTIRDHCIIIDPNAKVTERVIVSKLDEDQIIYEGRKVFDYLFWASRENPDFLKQLKLLIYPRKKINYLNLPKDKISVAMHIRLGGQFETVPGFGNEISLRVPPLEFYIEQLKKLSNFLNNRPLFVYLFTNHSEPPLLVREIKKKLPEYHNIVFGFRDINNQDNTISEDFFRMAQFDCLIRPNSAFSKRAQLIGDHKIIIYPKNGVWKNRRLIVDRVGMITTNIINHRNLRYND